MDPLYIEGLIKGDKHCFQKVFEVYHPQLYRHVLRFVKSQELTEDIIQEVFIKLWENRHHLNPTLSLKAYLYKICKNHIINILNRAAKESSMKKEILISSAFSHTQSEDNFIYSQYISIANEAIEHLPAQRKIVFKMCRLEGLEYQEVADKLGISKHTVRDHMQKAGKFIKEYFFIIAKITLALFPISFS